MPCMTMSQLQRLVESNKALQTSLSALRAAKSVAELGR